MQKILFMTGSMNQTLQMHSIATKLAEFDCWFSQLFTDSFLMNSVFNKTNLLNSTVMADQFRKNSEKYLRGHGLQIDYGAKLNHYDLIVYCSDMIIPERTRNTKTIWVQEGMVDRYTIKSLLVNKLKLPRYFCGDTSLNGSSNVCDIYCTASAGYKEYFASKGTQANKIAVTGIPNYDNLQVNLYNDFPHHNYVMVATTDLRETFRFENRPAFIKKAVKIAAGRQLLFKLHPNENTGRAKAEIARYAPENALVFTSGNTNHMIANCCELITQYSTVVYTGIILGKKVHSWFNIDELKRLAPVQNGGSSALNIAQICRSYIHYKGNKQQFNPQAVLASQTEEVIAHEEIYV
ncbi:hypothetical protein ACFQ3S_12735 [Mucilaginibacter terrae]|uniref:hypothetical protein n=1 Tax=Mucilaginibacter terrae TaxID=1955052 RepID=UPI0036252A92